MKKWKGGAAGVFVACALLIAAGLAGEASAQQEVAILANSDCVKCHTDAPRDIAERGGRHQTEVTCQDCHDGHPPTVTDIIPQCSNCHSGKAHYELENCLQCHSNPHAPLALTLAENLTTPCLTCHTEQKAQLDQFPSMHTEQDCTTCHTVHGQIPSCLDCHEGHAPEMVQADCSSCHRAHQPLMVAYSEDLASKQCASCHEEAFTLLMASTTKHKDVSCATCHQATHKMVPQCQDCHGVPHPEGIVAKFPKCGDCHNIAHDLNR